MPRSCSICSHPQRIELEGAVLAGRSIRASARTVDGISPFALRRHLQHVATVVAQRLDGHEKQERVAGALRGRVEQIISDARRIMKAAEGKEQFSAALQGIRTQLGCLRMLGELSGELKNGSAGEFVSGNVGASASVSVTLPATTTKEPVDLIAALREIYHLNTPDAPSSKAKPPVM